MFDTKEEIIYAAQGNPGAIRVLCELIQEFPGDFSTRLLIALRLTGSKASNLWVVYKDLCNFSLDKTKAMLEEWFDNSSVSLEHWLRAVKSVEYAEVPE